MYIGHFAIAVLAHALLRDVHALPLLLGTSFLDLLDGLLAFPGVTQVRANANAGPYLFYDLIFIDWDHSLSAAAFWSLVCLPLCLAAGYEQRTALATAAVCLSHWLADWPMHNHDLALYPHSERHFGGALWSRLGTWSWILEGLLSALCLIFAARQRQMSKWVPVTFAITVPSAFAMGSSDTVRRQPLGKCRQPSVRRAHRPWLYRPLLAPGQAAW